MIDTARSLVNPTEVPGGAIKEVGCALMTRSGKTFSGVSMHLCCGIGFCAEHSAVADLTAHSDETEIKTIVAVGSDKMVWFPCGRCRELLRQINKFNFENCDVIISEDKKIKLKELIPGNWR